MPTRGTFEHETPAVHTPLRGQPSDEVRSASWNPPRPEDVDEAEWEVVIKEARRLVGGVRGLHFDSPSQEVWIPKGIGYNT